MFLDHPVLGVGLGDFPEEYALRYASPGRAPMELAPHSIYVQTLSELGLAGAIPLLLILFSFWRLNARSLKSLSPPAKREKRPLGYYLAHGLNLAMVGFLISGAFLTVLYYPHLWILLGLSVGAYSASARPELATTQLEPEEQPGGLALAIPGGGGS
jgi:O-antigen ligase